MTYNKMINYYIML